MSTEKLLLPSQNNPKDTNPALGQEEKKLKKGPTKDEIKQDERKEKGETKSEDKAKEESLHEEKEQNPSETNEQIVEKPKKTQKKTKTQVPNPLKKLQVNGSLLEQVPSKRKRTQTTQFQFYYSSLSDPEGKKSKKQDQGKPKNKRKPTKPNAQRAFEDENTFDSVFAESSLFFPFLKNNSDKEIKHSESSNESQKVELQEGLKLLSRKLFLYLTEQLALFQSDKVRNFYQDKKQQKEDGNKNKEAATSNQKSFDDYENVFIPKENIGLIKQIAIESNRYCNATNREIILEFCFVDSDSKRFGFRVFNLKTKSSKHLNKEQDSSNSKDVVGPSQIVLFEMDLKNSEETLVLVSEKPALRVFTSIDCKNFQALKKEYQDFCLKSNLQRKFQTTKSSLFSKAEKMQNITEGGTERKTKKKRRHSTQTAEQKKNKLKKAKKKKEEIKKNSEREEESTLPEKAQAQLPTEGESLTKEKEQELAPSPESEVGAKATNKLSLSSETVSETISAQK